MISVAPHCRGGLCGARSVPAIIKVYGAHLKASAAMVRLRLYDILALLPPKTYEGTVASSPALGQNMNRLIVF